MIPDRRSVLALGAAAAALPALGAAKDPIAGWTVINALGGLLDPNTPDLPTPDQRRTRILGDAHASGMTAVNCTFGYVFGPKEPFESTVADVAYWDRLVRENPRDLVKVLTTADIARAKADKKIGVDSTASRTPR